MKAIKATVNFDIVLDGMDIPTTKPTEKEVFYQIRISKEEKAAFMQMCKEKGFNSSAIVRKLIVEWTEKQQAK